MALKMARGVMKVTAPPISMTPIWFSIEHATEVSKSLYRAVDAHHVQLLNKSASMSILVANYFKTSLSEKTGLYEGQIIETRHGRGPRSWTEARVERVNDDG